jgi:hypothetical protein
MDKILSARIEESVVSRINSLARRLHTSKKKVIENAIEVYASKIDKEQGIDVFRETCGAWPREESPAQTVDMARKAFRNSIERHQT